jgi:hypothetical protein
VRSRPNASIKARFDGATLSRLGLNRRRNGARPGRDMALGVAHPTTRPWHAATPHIPPLQHTRAAAAADCNDNRIHVSSTAPALDAAPTSPRAPPPHRPSPTPAQPNRTATAGNYTKRDSVNSSLAAMHHHPFHTIRMILFEFWGDV